jgi:hypothetical protein
MRTGGYGDDWEERAKRIRARDGYECQRCGATNTELHVNHITPIREGGSHDESNLETICRSCHAAEHPTKVTVSEALSNNQRLRMKYRSSSGTRVRELDPYGMTMYEGIQYLVGHDYYRDEIRIFRPKRIAWAETLSQTFTPPENWDTEQYLADKMGSRRTGETDCFIATAAYGTPHAEEIDLLRDFRDDTLNQTIAGRMLVRLYYWLSPPIAEWISQREWRQKLVQRLVVAPAVRAAALWTGS